MLVKGATGVIGVTLTKHAILEINREVDNPLMSSLLIHVGLYYDRDNAIWYTYLLKNLVMVTEYSRNYVTLWKFQKFPRYTNSTM